MSKPTSPTIPPYVAYRTFRNFLDGLATRGLPSRIDRSLMPHKSGTIQSQLLLALGYLNLIKPTGQPTELLERLLGGEGAQRKAVLREIMQAGYGFVFRSGFDLESATTQQMEDLFQETGASGETVRRALAFFLSLARAAGIPVSPYIKPHQHKGSAAGRRATSLPDARPAAFQAKAGPPKCRTIRLQSGGHLKLELSVDIFDLDAADRRFLFDLIDQLRAYQEKTTRNPP